MARLTAQGTHALVWLFDPRTHAGDEWLVDLEHGTKIRETFHDRPGGLWAASFPEWHRNRVFRACCYPPGDVRKGGGQQRQRKDAPDRVGWLETNQRCVT